MRGWVGREIRRQPLFFAALLVVAAAWAAYADSLHGAFHFDDLHHVVHNPFLRDLGYLPAYFSRPDMFSALPGHNMYRPVVLATFALDYHWGGFDPLAWRLTAIALHALASLGLLFLFRALALRFSARPARAWMGGALAAALFFALHPVFTETVDYTSARSSLLATGFSIWALIAHLHAGARPPGPGRIALWILSLLLFTLALLSKEIAIVVPLLLLWLAVIERRHLLAVLPALAVAGIYLYVRQIVLGTAVVDFATRSHALAAADPGSGGSRPVLWNLFTQARVLLAYVSLLLVPVGLCVDRAVRISRTLLEPAVLGGVALVLAVLVAAWRGRGRNPLLALGLVWFLVALAPTSSIIPLNQVMNEHRLYLPGVGAALVLGAVVARMHRPRVLPMTALGLLLCALTLRRNLDWRDPVRLWRQAVAASPDAAPAWNALGAQLRIQGRYDEAETSFRRCLELEPASWNAAFNLGTLHLQRGHASGDMDELAQAETWLRRSLKMQPHSERSRWYLAETRYQMGRVREAEQAFRALAGLNPRLYEMTRYPLARIALDRGHYDRARELYEAALREGRDPVSAYLGLAETYSRRGETKRAAGFARKAMKARPHSPRPHLFLARLFPATPVAAHHLFEAERRGYRPTPEERAAILGGRAP